VKHPDQKTIPIPTRQLRALIETSNKVPSVDDSFRIQDEFLKQIRSWLAVDPYVSIAGLEDFPFVYITNGISNAIETLIYEERHLVIHEDEYPFYRFVRPDSTIVTNFAERECANNLVVLSNPFSRNGNIDHALYQSAVNTGASIWLDCAYMGSIAEGKIKLADSVETVCFSFSKGFSLQYNRIGVMFSKKQNPILEIYKEFAYVNSTAANIALSIMNTFGVSDIARLFKPHQVKICKNLGISPADCVWLGESSAGEKVSLYEYLLNEAVQYIN